VLSIEHLEDPVPVLDGTPNPVRRNWTTLVVHAPEPVPGRPDPLAGHRLELYRRTAARLDAAHDPAVEAWKRGAQSFLAGPADGSAGEVLCTGWNVDVSRAASWSGPPAVPVLVAAR
jgi:hypothetical protein